MEKVYSVRLSPKLKGLGVGQRRRAGLSFGHEEKLVSLDAHPGVDQVDEDAIAAILADEHLRTKEVTAPEPEMAPESDPGDETESKPDKRKGRRG